MADVLEELQAEIQRYDALLPGELAGFAPAMAALRHTLERLPPNLPPERVREAGLENLRPVVEVLRAYIDAAIAARPRGELN
jgi:hypothetical protein